MLPLHQGAIVLLNLVPEVGFEPTNRLLLGQTGLPLSITPAFLFWCRWSDSNRQAQASEASRYTNSRHSGIFKSGAQDRTRTCKPFGITLSTLRVYQIPPHEHIFLVGREGIEPISYQLTGGCFRIELSILMTIPVTHKGCCAYVHYTTDP